MNAGEEIVRAGENVVDAGAARLHEKCGGHAVARRHSGEVERLLDVVGVALPRGDARTLLRGVGHQPAHLLGVETGAAARSGGGAKRSGERVRAVRCVRLILLTTERRGEARADVVAERDGAQEARAVDAEAFAGGKCRRDDGRAGMRQRQRMRVVGLVRVGEDAVDEGGFDRPDDEVEAATVATGSPL